MELKTDVVVVGAGPAGSMTAKTIAENGFNVILLERNKEVGYPIRCAEGINKFLFTDAGIKKDKSFLRQKINKAKFYFYDQVYELKEDHWKGYTIDREIFDKFLVKEAENSGANVFLNSEACGMRQKKGFWIVDVKTKKEVKRINAKVVVGAGGFDCKVGQWAGITKPWGLRDFSKCLEFQISGLNLSEEDAFHIAFGVEFSGGYGWIFPKSKSTANVGVGVDPKIDSKKALYFFMNHYPGIKKMLGGKYIISKTIAGAIPSNGPKPASELVGDGVILVGDSAGIVEPVTGEGIASSILSGISAGEVISNCLKKDVWDKKNLRLYDRTWRNKSYMGSTLGKEMDLLIGIKKSFSYTDKNWKEKIITGLKSI